jgi:hypothetical protein
MINQIDIERKLPIINGYVQIPDGQIDLRNLLTSDEAEAAIPGATTIRVSGDQRSDRAWLVLPVYDREDGLEGNDYFQTLRDAAAL